MPKLIESPKLMEKEPYSSIMSLLMICSNLIPDFDGLTHSHFLYALSDKKGMKQYKMEEMKEYFLKIYVPSLEVQLGIKNPKRKRHISLKSLEDFYIGNRGLKRKVFPFFSVVHATVKPREGT